MSWLLKSKRLQSAGANTNNINNNSNTATSGSNIHPTGGHGIYSLGSNNLSTSSVSSLPGLGHGYSTHSGSNVNLHHSSVSLALNTAAGTASSGPHHPHSIHHSHPSHHPHHLDAGEDMVRQFAASQLDTQKSTFIRWVNVQLQQAHAALTSNVPFTPMTVIERDLRDGKRLIQLLEHVSGEPLKPERSNMRIHQMANVSKALTYLEKSLDNENKDALASIGNEDIVDGNLKLTLGLVWLILYRFRIQHIANTMLEIYPTLTEDSLESEDTNINTNIKGKKKSPSSQQVDAKQALLRWVRYQLEDYSDVIPPAQDFHRSWRTGLTFAALIHRHDPNFLPDFYTAILPLLFESTDEWRRTLTQAFDLACEKMALPRLLDPEDLVDVETPDERSIMAYVSEYYLVMSKYQHEEDPAQAAQRRDLRIQAKRARLALAGEDMQVAQQRIQEEENRKRLEEQEELERIRLRRMEIEGWSIRAAEKAKEEEEALRRRREEEEEKRQQRKQRREQRERERVDHQRQDYGLSPKSSTAGSSILDTVFSESEHEYSDSETEMSDPQEQEQRQRVLNEKLAEYHQGIIELSEWIKQQDVAFPRPPDTSSPLDRARDLEPLVDAIKKIEEEQAVKEHLMSHLHDVREELLEYENPDLPPEQISEMDKRWWELETIWTALSNRVVEAKDAAEEVKWIIDCSQEIIRVNGEILKFESQLEAAAKKRSEETPQDRCVKSALEQQDVNLSSISFLLKTYVDFLTSLMDPKVHHYTAPEHLTALNNELTTVRLPHLAVIIEQAQKNLANDRLLRSFLDAFILSEAWIGESVEWLANIENPVFVTRDVWHGTETVKGYLARDSSKDLDLDFYAAEVEDLKTELGEEQSEVNTFRSSGFAKLDEQAKAAEKSLRETEDNTADETIAVVHELMDGVMKNLVKVENLLPKEADHCAYTARVLNYLIEADLVLEQLEYAVEAIQKWEMRQPDEEVEARIISTEKGLSQVDYSLEADSRTPAVRESVPARHHGLKSLVKDLRACFSEKQVAIHGDRQMKQFLERTLSCQEDLRELRARLEDSAPMTGFGLEDPTPFDTFAARTEETGKSLDSYENLGYSKYVDFGALVKAMAMTSAGRHDPATVANKLESVERLKNDIRALFGDRVRDVQTVAECREVAQSLKALREELAGVETDLIELEHVEPDKRANLVELGNKANQLNSQYALLEQNSVFRFLAKDPTCTELLKEIKDRQSSIQTTQERLHVKLDIKEKWNFAWESFSDRAKTLEEYLVEVEQDICGRDVYTVDVVGVTDKGWRGGENGLREVETANAETEQSLNDVKTSRMTELSTLAKALKQIIEQAGGIENLDESRAIQAQEIEKIQKDLREHLQKLSEMNAQENARVEMLRQRLTWLQRLDQSKAETDSLKQACQDTVQSYAKVLEACKSSNDTSDLNMAAAERMEKDIQHIATGVSTQKKKAFDKGIRAHSKLLETMTKAAGSAKDIQPSISTESTPSSPSSSLGKLEDELVEFKDGYESLDHQLDYAKALAEYAARVASFLEKMEETDHQLVAITSELKAEDQEASPESLTKVAKFRQELDQLAKEFEQIVDSIPKPTADVTSKELEECHETLLADLKSVLKSRLDRTMEQNQYLEPLLTAYKDLLQYQDGLRSLVTDLNSHQQWIKDSQQELQSSTAHLDKLHSYLDESIAKKFNSLEELSTLTLAIDQQSNHVDAKKEEFLRIKKQIQSTLQMATPHSKKLQEQLESSLEEMEQEIRQLESGLLKASRQIECHKKRRSWETAYKEAKGWCRNFEKSVEDFVEQQARWSGKGDQEDKAALAELEAATADFEARLKTFEDHTKSGVNKAWPKYCGSLVYVDARAPESLEREQSILEGEEIERMKAWVAYSAGVVKQRKALAEIAEQMRDLEKMKDQLALLKNLSQADLANSDSVADGVNGYISIKDLEHRVRSLSQEIETCLGALPFPLNHATDGTLEVSRRANDMIRKQVDDNRGKVFMTVQTLEDVLSTRDLSRKQFKLEAICRDQDLNIQEKNQRLEKISGLVQWANETSALVAGLLSKESSKLVDGSSGDMAATAGEKDLNAANLLRNNLQHGQSQREPSMSTLSSMRHSDSIPSLATLSLSESTQSISTLTPSSPVSESPHSKHHESVRVLAQLPRETLEALVSRIGDLNKETENMCRQKSEVGKEIETSVQSSKDLAAQVEGAEYFVEALAVAGTTRSVAEGPSFLKHLEKTVVQNQETISHLDAILASKMGEFDIKSSHIKEVLSDHGQTIFMALKERVRADEEEAYRLEAERLRIQREQDIQDFEESKAKFLEWSEATVKDLNRLWETHGFFAKNEELVVSGEKIVLAEDPVVLLESETLRYGKELEQYRSAYETLQDQIVTLYDNSEDAQTKQGHKTKIDDAWSLLNQDYDGYRSLLKQMNDWSELRGSITRFERESLDSLEKRVEALRWMPWESFQQEEDTLLDLIRSLEEEAHALEERSNALGAIERNPEWKESHAAILEANKVYFEQKMETARERIQTAKTHMDIIHETSKEIALHAKFHADLVRIETAIAQQIDAVKARLGSLERSSCFALNSKALEEMVMEANDVCMDGKYQLSVLQEVEYPTLEQTAFDLDIETVPEPDELGSPIPTSRTGVQESMDRIRHSLKKLEGYVEEECFETLLAAKFYTHAKATEDIRQWITACRDSMAQLDSATRPGAQSQEELSKKARRQQANEWKLKHLGSLEKKLNAFDGTVQNYDVLSGDFMLLHHPASSSLDVSELGDLVHDGHSTSMRMILRQTVQERTKRTREDWELLKQEFLEKTVALEDQSGGSEHGGDDFLMGDSLNGSPVKAKTFSRFGTEILDDITRLSREVQELFDHGASNHSTLSLAVGSDGALIKSKDSQERLEEIEAYIRNVLQAKVDEFDRRLSEAQRSDQEHIAQELSSPQDQPSKDYIRHQEKMVGVAMQRGQIAESMNRLVESCHHHRREVEELLKLQNGMDVIQETNMLLDKMQRAIGTAENLLKAGSKAGEGAPLTGLYMLSSASSTSSLTSINIATSVRSPNMSPITSPPSAASRAAANRSRRSSRVSSRRSLSISSMTEEEAQKWEESYRGWCQKLEGLTHEIEQRLDMVSMLSDRLTDWRLDEHHGVLTERWQRTKKAAVAKKQELDRFWEQRNSQGSTVSMEESVHPFDPQTSPPARSSLMQPTASSNNRVKAILGSPVDSSFPPRKKRFSTGNIMARGNIVPPSPTSSLLSSGRPEQTTMGRMRSGTAPGRATTSNLLGGPAEFGRRPGLTASPSLQTMSPTSSFDTRKRPLIMRRNGSTSSVSSMVNGQGVSSPIPARLMPPQQPRVLYKADPNNALDIEVAKVVNASGFTMKVQKLKDGPIIPPSRLTGTGGDVTPGGVQTPSGGQGQGQSSKEGGVSGAEVSAAILGSGFNSASSSPKISKTIRGQGRMGLHTKTYSDASNLSGEVGRYVFGDVEPKICYCRILRSRKVMVRVGGGWTELSKFMEDHASLEQRKSKSRMLSASSSTISVASTSIIHSGGIGGNGSMSMLSGSESRQLLHPPHQRARNLSTDSFSDSQMSGISANGHGRRGGSGSGSGSGIEDDKGERRNRMKKELVYHIRPSDDLSLKPIKFVKSGAGEGLVAI